jgi:hypothetical protein
MLNSASTSEQANERFFVAFLARISINCRARLAAARDPDFESTAITRPSKVPKVIKLSSPEKFFLRDHEIEFHDRAEALVC